MPRSVAFPLLSFFVCRSLTHGFVLGRESRQKKFYCAMPCECVCIYLIFIYTCIYLLGAAFPPQHPVALNPEVLAQCQPEAPASCLPPLTSSGCAFQKRIARRNSNLPPHRSTALR
jgi:hypothetical protein